MADRELPPRPKPARSEGKNVHRGHILPRGEWVNEYGSKFTSTGVHWSADESRMHERQNQADRDLTGDEWGW